MPKDTIVQCLVDSKKGRKLIYQSQKPLVGFRFSFRSTFKKTSVWKDDLTNPDLVE